MTTQAELEDYLKKIIEEDRPNAPSLVSNLLQDVYNQLGAEAANKLIRKFDLTKKYGLQEA